MLVLLLVCGGCSFDQERSLTATTLNSGATPEGEPEPGFVRRPDRMTAELTGPVRLDGEVPLTLTLFSKSDGARRDFTNYSFTFVVLDEDGNQVGGPHVSIREAITVKLELDGKEATYEPRLHFYPGKEGLVPGRRYQLVCAMPPRDLAAAVSFTLGERRAVPGH